MAASRDRPQLLVNNRHQAASAPPAGGDGLRPRLPAAEHNHEVAMQGNNIGPCVTVEQPYRIGMNAGANDVDCSGSPKTIVSPVMQPREYKLPDPS